MSNREDDLDRELRAHPELEAEELRDADAARRSFGNVARTKENVRDEWGFMWIERMSRDFTYALRQMRRSPGFSAVAMGTLAVGLGAIVAMFCIVNGDLLVALGASAAEVRRLILLQGMMPVMMGLAAGSFASVLLAKLIASQLYGIAPNDLLTISMVAIVLLVVAVSACWFPARRAARIDPLTALRFE